MIELLSPAGNFEKFKAAIRFGADAVYLAGNAFGMRAAADNFSVEEIYEATRIAHKNGKKVFVTVNTMPHTIEYPLLREYLDSLKGSGIDAVIAADLGVIGLVREMLPDTDLHISTQASVVSAEAAEAYHRLGAKRVVLARELTLKEIAELKKNISKELEIECFVHGSMCIAWSGRCLLSNYLTGRDGNRGMCAQPCRWNYKEILVEEEFRKGHPIPIEEDGYGSFVMASRDLCMVEHIPELVEAGIDSLKIEGRMKSVCYTAVTANVYRMAIDKYYADPEGFLPDEKWTDELLSISHREYDTGFFFDKPSENAKTVSEPGYIRDKVYAGTVTSYDEKTKRASFVQMNKISEGDTVEILTPGKTAIPFTAEDLRDENGEKIASTPHPQMRYSLPVPVEVGEGDILRS